MQLEETSERPPPLRAVMVPKLQMPASHQNNEATEHGRGLGKVLACHAQQPLKHFVTNYYKTLYYLQTIHHQNTSFRRLPSWPARPLGSLG